MGTMTEIPEAAPAGEEIEPANGDAEFEDTAPFRKTYLAIDGIEHDDLLEEDQEVLVKRVIDFLLTHGYPIEDVRLLGEDSHVIEVHEGD